MLSLHESILSTTGTGEAYQVKKWLDDYFERQRIAFPFRDFKYALTKDNKITNANRKANIYTSLGRNTDVIPLQFVIDEKVPSYIRFDKVLNEIRFGSIINEFKQNQLPEYIRYLKFSCREIPEIKMKIGDYVRITGCSVLKGLDLEFTDSYSNKNVESYSLQMMDCDFPVEDIKKINVKSIEKEKVYISIDGGKLAISLQRNIINKLRKSKEEAVKYMDSIFSNMNTNHIHIYLKSSVMSLRRYNDGEWDINKE